MSTLFVNNIKHTGGTSAMTINSSGLVIPKTPILQVNSTDTDQTVTASGATTALIQWETVEIDTLNAWDSSNHRYQPTIAGYYLVGGSLRAKFSTNVHSYFTHRLPIGSLMAIMVSSNWSHLDRFPSPPPGHPENFPKIKVGASRVHGDLPS